MYSPVHADRTGRILVSADSVAVGMAGLEPLPLTEVIPLPPGARVVPLDREAVGLDRADRARSVGKGRLAVGAVLPAGFVRLMFPAYVDDAASLPLAPLAYAAVAADAAGELVVAARPSRAPSASDPGTPPYLAPSDPLRDHSANALVRQLARCSREHECVAARLGMGGEVLAVPLGSAPAERPTLPLDLRSGYESGPREPAAFHPTAAQIEEIAILHLERGGGELSFGRACDGEPLRAIRVLEAAVTRIRRYAPNARFALETTGSDPRALRRAIAAGIGRVTFRIAAARPDTYEILHGPMAHHWNEVRTSIQAAAEQGAEIRVALLATPGLTDRDVEIDSIVTLASAGARVELRDLGSDPVRVLSALPRGRATGMAALLARLADLRSGHVERATDPAAI